MPASQSLSRDGTGPKRRVSSHNATQARPCPPRQTLLAKGQGGGSVLTTLHRLGLILRARPCKPNAGRRKQTIITLIMDELPGAGAAHTDAVRRKIDAAVAAKNLGAVSNNTRWDELINHFRSLPGWRPSYRSKSVTGYVSGWDVEWFYHLPFPFASVEWFDIGLSEGVPAHGRLLVPPAIDHTEEISKVVKQIGFEFEVRGDVLRIWGYMPKSYEDFPPA